LPSFKQKRKEKKRKEKKKKEKKRRKEGINILQKELKEMKETVILN